MPTYEHKCEACEHEWEDLYKITDPVPEACPECKTEGKVKRLISWCSGTVELTGKELIAKSKEDTKKMKSKISTNENFRANFMGEDRYQAQVVRNEKIKKDYGKNS